MGYQSKVDDATLERIRNFVRMLNDEYADGSLIVVEGKRDADALARVGFTGTPTIFHNFKGIVDFLDSHQPGVRKMILLLDMDRTGRFLTRKILSQLRASRHDVNLSYKSALAKITKGKVKHVEDLAMFAPHLSGVTGSRRDLYFYT